MGGSKTDVFAHERKTNRVTATHDTLSQDDTRSILGAEDNPDDPGIKSTYRDPSTKDGKLRWD